MKFYLVPVGKSDVFGINQENIHYCRDKGIFVYQIPPCKYSATFEKILFKCLLKFRANERKVLMQHHQSWKLINQFYHQLF